jgi:hypothetical protein
MLIKGNMSLKGMQEHRIDFFTQYVRTDEGWPSLPLDWSDNFYFYLGEALFAAPSF